MRGRSRTGKFLLVTHGTANEVARAKDIIDTTNPTEANINSKLSEAKAA